MRRTVVAVLTIAVLAGEIVGAPPSASTSARADAESPAHSLYMPSVAKRSTAELPLLGRLGGRTSAVAAVDDLHVLAAIGSRLQPFVVRPDGGMVPAGPSLQLPGLVRRIVVVDQRALVATEFPAGLYVVDVARPAQPRLLGAVATPGAPVDIAVSNGRMILCEFAHVRTVDLTDGLDLREIGSTALDGASAHRCALTTTGAVIVSAEETDGRFLLPHTYTKLLVVDVTSPSAPSLSGEFFKDGSQAVYDLVAEGGDAYALLAQSNLPPPQDRELSYQLVHFGLANPAEPVVVGADPFEIRRGWSGALATGDGVLYVATPETFTTFDAASGESLGSTPFDQPVYGLTVAARHAIVAGRGLSAVDIEDRASPRVVGRLQLPAGFVAVASDGSSVYGVELEGSSRLVRLAGFDATEAGPLIGRWWAVGGSATNRRLDVAASNSTAVVLAGGRAHFIDLLDGESTVPAVTLAPADPGLEYESIQPFPDGHHFVAVVGKNTGELAECDHNMIGLDVIDTTNVGRPSVVSESRVCVDETSDFVTPTDLAVSESHAFVSVKSVYMLRPRTYSSGGTVIAFDLSDPLAPREVARYAHEGWPRCPRITCEGVHAVATESSKVYLGGVGGGLSILEMDSVGGFRHVGGHPVLGREDRIVVDGRTVYVADNRGFQEVTNAFRAPGRLTAFDVSQAAAPTLEAAVVPAHALDLTVANGSLWAAAGDDGIHVYEGVR